jgi:hypothetical protein
VLAVVPLPNGVTKVLLTNVQMLCGCSTDAHTSVFVIVCSVPPRSTEVFGTIRVEIIMHLTEAILPLCGTRLLPRV